MAACQCSERHRPFMTELPPGSNERPRQWFVVRRNESRSAFNGYRQRWSDYCWIECRVCGAYWKTKAAWTGKLENCRFWPNTRAPRVEPLNSA